MRVHVKFYKKTKNKIRNSFAYRKHLQVDAWQNNAGACKSREIRLPPRQIADRLLSSIRTTSDASNIYLAQLFSPFYSLFRVYAFPRARLVCQFSWRPYTSTYMTNASLVGGASSASAPRRLLLFLLCICTRCEGMGTTTMTREADGYRHGTATLWLASIRF